MKQRLMFIAAKVLAAATLVLGAPLASAGGHPDVSWSITVGSSYPAPRVYSPPPVVYVEPEPVVYVRPAPVYVYSAPVVRYGRPHYVEEVRYKKFRHHDRHWKGHHHGHRGRHHHGH